MLVTVITKAIEMCGQVLWNWVIFNLTFDRLVPPPRGRGYPPTPSKSSARHLAFSHGRVDEAGYRSSAIGMCAAVAPASGKSGAAGRRDVDRASAPL